jgi:hypothetical protein
MGKIRNAVKRLLCGTCGADGYAPCVHRVTGKPLKNFHSSRRCEGRAEVLNKQVAHIEGDDDPEEFWMFCFIFLGLRQADYPKQVPLASWDSLYQKYPDINPHDQYHGDF